MSSLEQVHVLPWGTAFLADFGAHVIRVESADHRNDRRSDPFPDHEPGDEWWDEGGREVGPLQDPGAGLLIDGSNPVARGCAAPRLGERDREVYGAELGLSDEEPAALRAAGAI